MSDFLATADLLRAARDAQQRFLGLWALDCLFEDARFFEKIHRDLHRNTSDRSSEDDGRSINH